MNINESVYGLRNTWITAPYYSDDIPTANRILMANFGDNESTLEKAIAKNKLPLNEPIDKSVCYCGVGPEHPLSKVQYFYSSFESDNPLILENINSDARDVTNISLGFGGDNETDGAPLTNVNYMFIKGEIEYSGSKAKYNRYTNGAEYSNEYSKYRAFKPWCQVPVKRFVVVPYIKCYNTSFNQSGTFDLKEYLTTRKNDYPYVTQILMDIVTDRNTTYDPDKGTGTPQRNGIGYTTAAILDPLSYGNGYIYNSIDMSNIIKPILGVCVAGVFFDVPISSGDTWAVKCFPVASGFGLDFTNVSNLNVDGEFSDETSRFYLDIANYTDDEFKDSVFKTIACFGLFFTESYADAEVLPLDDDKMYLGILNNGVGLGDYVHGSKNREQSQWNFNDMHDNVYDPSNPPQIDDNTYDGAMRSGLLGTFSTATDIYNIDTNDFTHLVSKLWDAMALVPSGDPLNDYCLDTFLTTNPIDSIVSLKYFPISEEMGINTTTVKLGKYDTSISCKYAKNSLLVDCGDVLIYPRFGIGGAKTWLDKMTTITLYLPFCGTLSLDPEKYMGRYVNVEYAIDLLSGNCSAFVSIIADNGNKCITDIANGTCGIDCSVTGIQHITLDSQLYNATEQLKAMRINNAVSGLTNLLGLSSIKNNDLTGAVSQLATAGGNIYNMLHNEDIAEYNLQHTQLPVKMIGTTGATTGAMCELYPTIIIERPDDSAVNKTAFAKTNGYACCISDSVGNFTGYTEFSSVDLSGLTATATEKNAIISALQGGVII